MRVYIPPGAGLGDRELSAMRRLSENSRRMIVDELQHPDSHATVKWILNQRDPEAALADAIAENIHQASKDAASGLSGIGDGLGRSFFKRLARFHRKLFHMDPIHKAVFGGNKKHHSAPPPAPPAPTPAPDTSSAPPPPPPPPPPVYVPPPTPDASQYTQSTQGPVNYVQEQPPPDPSAPPPPDPSVAAAPAPPVAAAPSAYSTGTDETAGLPTASGYTLTVEGQSITNYPVPLSTLSSIVQSGTQPGDRFEIMADGVGTGLRVRTATGFISIPDSMRAQVMAMPHDQVLAMLTQASATVAATGVPTPDPTATPAAPAAGGSGTLWMMGAGTAVALAMAAAGGKRK